MSPFAYKLYISFFKALNVFLATTYDSLMKHFTGFAIIFTVGYMLFVGYMIMMGKFSKGNMISAGISLVILPAITFLFVKGDYLIWVVNPIVNTTTALSCYFIGLAQGSWTTSGEGLQGLFYNLDNMCYKIFDLVVKMDPPGGFMSKTWLFFQAIVAAIILFASYVAAYVAFLVQILLGFFCMYVFLVVGGICIFFAAFKQTRHIFFAWLKGLINYSLLIIFSSLIMTI
ncbi:MAG: type IV secretion system protein, partial [Desulfobacteraceae bacterium]|nr:type IV secretion system protein [Desulfobacteraceae bacterium]